jgi:GT2 family glycosyltransferase
VNLVARRTRSEWIAPANADVELSPGTLEALVRSGSLDSRAGLIAPRLVLPDGETQHSVHSFPTVGKASLQALGLERVSPSLAERLCMIDHWDPERGRRVDWAHGAFLLARRVAWDAIGGFDDSQWMYAEDLDLAWRMSKAGWHTRYEPRARVHHAVSAATTQAFGDERERRSMRAMYSWSLRRRGAIPTWGTAAVNTLATGARAAVSSGSERRRWMWHMRLHALGLRSRVKLLEG